MVGVMEIWDEKKEGRPRGQPAVTQKVMFAEQVEFCAAM